MKSWWLAMGFLTALPAPDVGVVSAEDFRRSRRLYPLVGLLVGGLLALLAWGCRRLGLPAGVEGSLLLAASFLFTGFLHLDGLLDCSDALWAPVPPARRLVILKDVHMGAFAFGMGFVVLTVFWQLLSLRPPLWLLVCLPVLSRAVVVLPMSLWPYARKDGSGILASAPWPERRAAFLTIFVVAALAAPAAWFFPWPALAVLVAQLAFSLFAARRLDGGLTGDCYGAAIVLSEVCGLLAWVIAKGLCSPP